jgi:hypothetical protein
MASGASSQGAGQLFHRALIVRVSIFGPGEMTRNMVIAIASPYLRGAFMGYSMWVAARSLRIVILRKS